MISGTFVGGNAKMIIPLRDTLGITIDPRIDEYIDARTYIEDNFNYAIFNNCYYIFGY